MPGCQGKKLPGNGMSGFGGCDFEAFPGKVLNGEPEKLGHWGRIYPCQADARSPSTNR